MSNSSRNGETILLDYVSLVTFEPGFKLDMHIVMPRCACACEAYSSHFVCVCVFVPSASTFSVDFGHRYVFLRILYCVF